VKEREAVQVIMEQKIKVLVQSVAQAAGTLVNTSPAGNSPAGQALAKVCLLFRFIIIVLISY
jgi:aspartokinase